MTAEYFDGWFADISRSAARQAIFTAGLGTPPEVGPSNGLPFSGLREIAADLDLGADDLLVDLACGRGGPGMWLARSLDVRLVGVDFSAEAVRQAMDRRSLFGLTDRATFQVGTLDATGLPSSSADAVVCIDAFQFSADHAATAAEIQRVVKPGGQVVLTTWEGPDPDDERLGRLRDVHLEDALWEAGFDDVVLHERRDWHETNRKMWEAVVADGPSDDRAMQSAYGEAQRSLARHDKMRRVMAIATAP